VRRIGIGTLIAVALVVPTGCGTSRQATGLDVPSDWTRPAAVAPQATPVVAPAWQQAVLTHAGWLAQDLDGGQASPASLAALARDAYALQMDGRPTGASRSYAWELAIIRATAGSASAVPIGMRYAIARVSARAVLGQLADLNAGPPD